MNYLAARQRQSDGRWDYTSHNDRYGTHAIGYCHQAGGGHHATQAEAEMCYREYLMDNAVYDVEERDAKRQCKMPGCEVWTQNMARVGQYQYYHLCKDHMNRESLPKVVPLVGTSVQS